MGPSARAETAARSFSRWPAGENCATSFHIADAFARCVATGNKSSDLPAGCSSWVPHQISSPCSNRKSSAQRFAARALACINKTRVAISGGAESRETVHRPRSSGLRRQMKLDGCNALITGASAGIGAEFARQLAGRARSLILVARREERLVELRDELQQQYPKINVRIQKVDLADPGQLKELIAWLDGEKVDVDLLVNNAGLGDLGPFVMSDPIRNEQMTLVNVVALTLLTRHLLPQMIGKRRGGILNISSSAGFLPIPGDAVYAATKAYVTS